MNGAKAALASFLNSKVPTLFLYSGGSAMKLYQEPLSVTAANLISFFPVDERFEVAESDSNHASFKKTLLYHTLIEAGATDLMESADKHASVEGQAIEYERVIRGWKASNPEGKVSAVFGIGTDGHTAGMMPFKDDPKEFKWQFESDAWYVGYRTFGKGMFSKRMTLTATGIESLVDEFLVLATDPEKKAVIERLDDNPDDVTELPARILRKVPGGIWITSAE